MGQAHKSQHFVPAFLLRRWESGTSGVLVAFRWEGDLFLSSTCKAKYVGKLDHLYSMAQGSPEPDVSLERDFLGPEVDDKAAAALVTLEVAGTAGLSPQEREYWTRFLVTQTLRSPVAVEKMRAMSRSFMTRRITAQLEEAGIAPDDEFLASAPELSDMAMKAFPFAVEASPLVNKIASATWGLLEFDEVEGELLIGDDPVSLDIDADTFTLAMPVGPKRLLLVCTGAEEIDMYQRSKTDVLCSMNEHMVENSQGSVYATSDRYFEFIKGRLPRGR